LRRTAANDAAALPSAFELGGTTKPSGAAQARLAMFDLTRAIFVIRMLINGPARQCPVSGKAGTRPTCTLLSRNAKLHALEIVKCTS